MMNRDKDYDVQVIADVIHEDDAWDEVMGDAVPAEPEADFFDNFEFTDDSIEYGNVAVSIKSKGEGYSLELVQKVPGATVFYSGSYDSAEKLADDIANIEL